MNTIVLAIAGGVLGALFEQGSGFVFGAALGAALGVALEARRRAADLAAKDERLERELAAARNETAWRLARMELLIGELRAELQSARAAPAAPARWMEPAAAATAPSQDAAAHAAAPVEPEPPAATAPAEQAPAPVAPQPAAGQSPSQGAPSPAAPEDFEELYRPDPVDAVASFVRELMFGGNTVVRVGIAVLLVGVSLLLRWAAEHALFPIELRMIAAGLIALALVVIGYRQREARPGFARTLQGGGVAGLYLVVFFAFRAYGLLPAGLAFALLAAIALSSGALAVAQDALALIVIGQIGGFLAPVLASTGSGSHVALFGYYLLLNLLILGVAWFKPWRALNLIGFVFTFGIGTTWGTLRYEPEHFATTEPFLIAFFLIYTAAPVMHALRRPDAERGWVDGTLVFGTPLAALGLQYAMVADMRFGMAFSALALAAFYVGLSRLLHARAPAVLRALVEAFLAIGIGFATLAIPYGFDNHRLTGATWALEGAGLYWVGVRQRRWLSRLAGAGLQVLAAGALLLHAGDWSSADADLPLANTRWLACALLCLAALFVARHAHAHAHELPDGEWRALQLLIASGLGFWFAGGLSEINVHVPERWEPGASVALLGATALALELAGRRLSWLPGRYPAALAVILMAPLLLVWELDLDVHPLGRGGVLGWPLGLAAALAVLARFVPDGPRAARQLHALVAWLCSALWALEMTHLVTDFAELGPTWGAAAFGAAVAAALFAIVPLARRTSRPFGEHRDVYMVGGAGVLAAALMLWTLAANTRLAGDPAPLPYVPLLNPLDLAQTAAYLAVFAWYAAMRRLGAPGGTAELLAAVPALIAALAFIGWNASLARSVHHYAGVPFHASALWRAVPLQVAFSVSWSLIGLVATVTASRRGLRHVWVIGAALLGVVVVKLFAVDLSRLSTIAKIGTFLVVGMLLVLVGYLAPVPPARRRETASAEGGSEHAPQAPGEPQSRSEEARP